MLRSEIVRAGCDVQAHRHYEHEGPECFLQERCIFRFHQSSGPRSLLQDKTRPNNASSDLADQPWTSRTSASTAGKPMYGSKPAWGELIGMGIALVRGNGSRDLS